MGMINSVEAAGLTFVLVLLSGLIHAWIGRRK